VRFEIIPLVDYNVLKEFCGKRMPVHPPERDVIG
jgi:hypothetical protein